MGAHYCRPPTCKKSRHGDDDDDNEDVNTSSPPCKCDLCKLFNMQQEYDKKNEKELSEWVAIASHLLAKNKIITAL
jgi:hypothetical protein